MTHFARSLAVAILAVFATPATAQPVNPSELIVLTTTTTQDSGILRVLTDAFAKKAGPGREGNRRWQRRRLEARRSGRRRCAAYSFA
jgi:hypothetical protein